MDELDELELYKIELEMECDELLRAQKELDKERKRYFALYYLAPFAYIHIDRDGKIEEANMLATRLLGADNLVSADFYRYLSPDKREDFRVLLEKLVKEQIVENYPLTIWTEASQQKTITLNARFITQGLDDQTGYFLLSLKETTPILPPESLSSDENLDIVKELSKKKRKTGLSN